MSELSLEFNLLDNAFDYVESAIKYNKCKDPRSLKYAVLHLDASIELFLKSRLVKEHWSLIFEDPDKASLQALESGDFVSVDLKSALNRLERIADIRINKSLSNNIVSLRNYRNRIQHYAIKVNADAIKSLLGFIYNFVIDFCQKELSQDIKEFKSTYDKIKEELQEVQEYVLERMNSLKDELNKKDRDKVFWCPDCNQDTLVTGSNEDPECLFCGEKKNAGAVAFLISMGKIKTCPKCGRETFALREIEEKGFCYYCVYCGLSGYWEECATCGRLFSADSGSLFCPDCLDKIKKKYE